QRLEYLVERAVTARKRDERSRTLDEVQLAHRKVVEAEAQLRRDVRIRELLARQVDVEADRRRAHVVRAAVRGLHDAGTAARHEQHAAVVVGAAAAADEPAELACDVVVAALLLDALRDCELPLEIGVAGIARERGLEVL